MKSGCYFIKKEDLKRKNFNEEDFFVSDTAKKLGIVNYPPFDKEQEVLKALTSTADMMQEIRDLLQAPITINSAYRCKQLNDAVGSKDTSQHLKGLACDFTSSKFGSPEKIVKFLYDKGFLADQCFNEGSWVHISRIPKNNRKMFGYYLLKDGKRKFEAL